MFACRQQPGTRHRHRRGVTLIELMVGVSILAVLLAVAAPSYREFGRSTRVTTQASELQSALAYARSESLRRGIRVTVCRSDDSQAATPACKASASWAGGWLVFVDNVQDAGNEAGVVDGADTVLRAGDPAQGSIVATTGNLGAWLSYSPQGLVRTDGGPANGAFTVCQAPFGRRIAVSPVGFLRANAEECS